MDDQISRQAAIDEIDGWIKAFWENGHKESAADARLIKDGIIQLPSAQPEIVRCGDCKYFKVEYGWNCVSYPVCEASPQRIVTPDDYCSFAERRTDEQIRRERT